MWIEFQSLKVSLKSYSINIATVVRKTYISKILPESSKDNYPRGKPPPPTPNPTPNPTPTPTRGGGGGGNCQDTLSENNFSNKFCDRRCTY